VLNFNVIEDGSCYRLIDADAAITFTVDRLRRDRGDLIGELTVTCGLAGAQVGDDGLLSVSTFNLSSSRMRAEQARRLASLSRAPQYEWDGVLEEFCQRVLRTEQKGQPAQLLHLVPPAPPDDGLSFVGLRLPARHATILFGDGGTCKSYLALAGLGELSRQGWPVGYFDYELDATDHAARLAQLFGQDAPTRLHYTRCSRPLVYEVDRLRRLIQQHAIRYVVIDSAGYATDGPPEAAESAIGLFRGVRQLGIGTLLLAHVVKRGEDEQADQRPFGSAFYHNSARATWNVKLAQTADEGRTLTLGLFNRKANLTALQRPVALEVEFQNERVSIQPVQVEAVAALFDSLPLWQRVEHLVRRGPLSLAAIARQLDAPVDSVEKAVKRKPRIFTRLLNHGDDRVTKIALRSSRRAS
jgi:hypothetical protein